jgi:hypothetical protein
MAAAPVAVTLVSAAPVAASLVAAAPVAATLVAAALLAASLVGCCSLGCYSRGSCSRGCYSRGCCLDPFLFTINCFSTNFWSFLPLHDLKIFLKESKNNSAVFIIPSPYNICPFWKFLLLCEIF